MTKILLRDIFGSNIITRNSIVDLFENKINNAKSGVVIIDFKGIKFISRSGAAEYFKQKKSSNKQIIEKNMADEIKSMFRLVINQLQKSLLINEIGN